MRAFWHLSKQNLKNFRIHLPILQYAPSWATQQRIRKILRFGFAKCQNALIEKLIIFFLDSLLELPSSSPERIVMLALQQNTRNGSGMLQDRVTKPKFPLNIRLLQWEAHRLDIHDEYSEICYFVPLNAKMPSYES